MSKKQRLDLVHFTVWTLVSIWAAFGSFELCEAVELLDETVTEDATHQDLDEEALVRLACSIKSDNPVGNPGLVPHSFIVLTSLTPSPSIDIFPKSTDLVSHAPAFLPLYQQFSVYRI
jgi:hypothetical protein